MNHCPKSNGTSSVKLACWGPKQKTTRKTFAHQGTLLALRRNFRLYLLIKPINVKSFIRLTGLWWNFHTRFHRPHCQQKVSVVKMVYFYVSSTPKVNVVLRRVRLLQRIRRPAPWCKVLHSRCSEYAWENRHAFMQRKCSTRNTPDHIQPRFKEPGPCQRKMSSIINLQKWKRSKSPSVISLLKQWLCFLFNLKKRALLPQISDKQPFINTSLTCLPLFLNPSPICSPGRTCFWLAV